MDSPDRGVGQIRAEDLGNLIGEIRLMARQFLSRERAHSFTPTALAMTALRRAKLTEQDWSEVRWENRAHFFSALSTAMRHAMIDYARHRRAKGRDKILHISCAEELFRELPAEAEERPERFLLLDDALTKLAFDHQRLADVLQQFYFLGYTIAEIAALSGISEKTVDRDLKRARVLLRKLLEDLPRAA
jgi:RNA polymerase sigma factor (TIGR02999 family)